MCFVLSSRFLRLPTITPTGLSQAPEYQQTQRLTEVRVTAGDVARVEEFRVRAGRLPFEQTIVQSRSVYDAAVRDIMNLLAAPQRSGTSGTLLAAVSSSVAPILEVDGVLDAGPINSDLNQLRALALDNRADVRVARANLRAFEKSTQLAEAQRRRDVIVGFEYQRVGEDDSVGVTAQIPLFTYNNQKVAIVQARAQQRTAEAQLRAVEFQVLTDVDKAWQVYIAAQRTLQLYSGSAVSDINRVRAITQYSYERGEASLFELLEVQRNYNQTLLGYNQARADYLNSHWLLEQAIGRVLP